MKPIGIKKKRERDLSWRVRLTLAILIIFFSISVVELFTGVRLPILFQLLVSALGGTIVVLTSDKMGELLTRGLYGTRRATYTTREQLSADLKKIKFYKREARFDEALQLANEILVKEPDSQETLFLKAQILWEGFGNAEAAKGNLRRVLSLVPKTEALHRWALSYYHELCEQDRP